jgi:hypothetical protein
VTKTTLFRKMLGRKIEAESTTGVTNGPGPGIETINRYANRYVAANSRDDGCESQGSVHVIAIDHKLG